MYVYERLLSHCYFLCAQEFRAATVRSLQLPPDSHRTAHTIFKYRLSVSLLRLACGFVLCRASLWASSQCSEVLVRRPQRERPARGVHGDAERSTAADARRHRRGVRDGRHELRPRVRRRERAFLGAGARRLHVHRQHRASHPAARAHSPLQYSHCTVCLRIDQSSFPRRSRIDSHRWPGGKLIEHRSEYCSPSPRAAPNTAQHSTAQCSTVQYSVLRYSRFTVLNCERIDF